MNAYIRRYGLAWALLAAAWVLIAVAVAASNGWAEDSGSITITYPNGTSILTDYYSATDNVPAADMSYQFYADGATGACNSTSITIYYRTPLDDNWRNATSFSLSSYLGSGTATIWAREINATATNSTVCDGNGTSGDDLYIYWRSYGRDD